MPSVKFSDLEDAIELVGGSYDTEAELAQCHDEVRAMFRKSGAYRRFSELLERHDKRDQWHRFRDERQRQALREWCVETGLTLSD